MTDQPRVQITLASPKGGVGKTMTTILLACEFANGGHKVLIIDMDPQASCMLWFTRSRASGYPLSNIEVIAITDIESLGERLKNPQDEAITLIDIQGTAAAAASAAVVHADFVVIPTKAHAFDIEQCLKLINQISILGGRNRSIPYAVLLTMVSGIDRKTAAFRAAYETLKEEKVNLLEAFLSQRPTFAAVAMAGSLYEVENDTQPIREARDQTNALAAEIIRRLNEGVQ